MTAHDAVVDAALALSVLNGVVGAYGVFRWYRVEPSRIFWLGLRSGQIAAVLFALFFGVLYLAGDHPSQNLFYLYALLPLIIGFVAEQLRIVAADQVLTNRDLDDAQQVGELPEAEQLSIVTAIVRRELGVMATSALVVCFLALRAAGTY